MTKALLQLTQEHCWGLYSDPISTAPHLTSKANLSASSTHHVTNKANVPKIDENSDLIRTGTCC